MIILSLVVEIYVFKVLNHGIYDTVSLASNLRVGLHFQTLL